MREDILEFLRTADVKRHWVGLEKAEEEIAALQQALSRAEGDVSSLDKLNVFTDSPEEVRVKDCRERLEGRRNTLKRDSEELSKVLLGITRLEPHFASSLELESLLKETLTSSHPVALKSVGSKLKAWLSKHESFAGNSVEMPSPGQALSVLLVGDFPAVCSVVRQIRTVLPLCEERTEFEFEEFRKTCSFRPLLLRLIERCRGAWGRDLPSVPWPSDLYRELWRGETIPQEPEIRKVLRETSSSEIELKIDEMEALLQELAGLELLIELNKRKISVMDRVVFWSDTEAESQEKSLGAQSLAIGKALKDRWLELCALNLDRRSRVWSAFLKDESGGISSSLKKIGVGKPKGILTKTCQVFGQEEAQARVDSFQQALKRRYPASTSPHRLRERAVMATPSQVTPQRDSLGNPPILDEHELVSMISRLFQETGYPERWAAVESLSDHAKEFREKYQEARSSQNLFGTLRSFVAPTAEEREVRRDLEAREHEALHTRRELEEEYEGMLFSLHPPSYLTYLAADLCLKVSQVRGEVRSETRRDSNGNTTTRYYSVLLGHGEALASAAKLQLSLQKESQDCPSAFQWLDLVAAKEVCYWLERQPVRI